MSDAMRRGTRKDLAFGMATVYLAETSLIGCDLIHSRRITFARSARVATDEGTWAATTR